MSGKLVRFPGSRPEGDVVPAPVTDREAGSSSREHRDVDSPRPPDLAKHRPPARPILGSPGWLGSTW
ncbi:MAG: hypothetical protein ACRDJF_08720, partial [Actinomycetota bacterium]